MKEKFVDSSKTLEDKLFENSETMEEDGNFERFDNLMNSGKRH